jgi:hypothetical protein
VLAIEVEAAVVSRFRPCLMTSSDCPLLDPCEAYCGFMHVQQISDEQRATQTSSPRPADEGRYLLRGKGRCRMHGGLQAEELPSVDETAITDTATSPPKPKNSAVNSGY